MPRDPLVMWSLMGMSLTAFLGFSITYFGPIFRGAYTEASTTVHLHGWSFFLWYMLVPLQAVLVRTRRLRIHRVLGAASVGLAIVMTVTGIVVATVILHRAGASPFWRLMGVPILSLMFLFAAFYAKAVLVRRRPQEHKRWILLASAAGLGAATFRIAVWAAGSTPAVWVGGFFLPWLLVLPAVVRDASSSGVPPVYKIGVPAGIGVPALMFLLMVSAWGDEIVTGLGRLGGLLVPLV